MILFEQRKGLTILSFFDQSDEPLDADMCRAFGLTGGRAFFIDGIRTGYGLRVLFECRSFLGQPFVVCIRKAYRTDLGTLSTAGTLGNVYKSGSLTDMCAKMTRLAFQRQKLGVC